MKIYRIAQTQEKYTPEQQRAIDFWKELDHRFPEVEKWMGNPTWDFGNGVAISLTNMGRDIFSDMLWNSAYRDPKEQLTVYVENIASKDKGKGYASLALEELKKIADKYGVILRLYPLQSKKDRKGLTTPKLKKWYNRKEFGDISDSKYDAWKSFPGQKPLYLERKPKNENI